MAPNPPKPVLGVEPNVDVLLKNDDWVLAAAGNKDLNIWRDTVLTLYALMDSSFWFDTINLG